MEDKQIPKPVQPQQQGSTPPVPTLPTPVLSETPAPTVPVSSAPTLSPTPTPVSVPAPAPTPMPTLPTAGETTSPVASAIGEIAAQPEIDNSATSDITASGQQVNPTPAAVPDASQAPANPQPGADNKTIKLPVPTSMLPALAIGALILVLFLAVALYAFVA